MAIVLAVRSATFAEQEPAAYAHYVRALCSRAEVRGARLVALSPAVVAFAWMDEGVEEAIGLTIDATRDDGDYFGLSFGLSQGSLVPLFADAKGAAEALAVGTPLSVAEALAEACGPKQLLVDGSTDAVRRGELVTVGEPAIIFLGSEQYVAHFCDLSQPWTSRPSIRSGQRVHYALMSKVAALGGGDSDGNMTEEVMLTLLADKSRTSGLAAVRASMALSLAYASLGQGAQALVEAMEALATARQEGHPRAVTACNALILKIYAGAGKRAEVEKLLVP